MNICIFTRSTTTHASSGGMETQTKLLIDGLCKKGNRLTLITTAHPAGTENETVNGVEIHYLKNTPSGVYSKKYFTQSSQKFLMLHNRNPFDTVISVSDGSFGYATELKKRLKVPLVIILHGTLLGEIKTRFKNLNSLKELIIFIFRIVPFGIFTYFSRDLPHLKKADFIIAVSKTVRHAARREYFIEQKNIGVVYNGVDKDKFKVQSAKCKIDFKDTLGIDKQEKVILYLGRLEKEKGVHLLLKVLPEVIARFRQVKLLVVGDGSQKEHLLQQKERLGISDSVIFVGKVSYNETPNYYNAADIFIYPSLRYEGLPMTVVEAMACGTPVIASSIGGIPEAVGEGVTGMLIDPGSVAGLTEAILALLGNGVLLSKLSENARKLVEQKFNQDLMISRTIKILETVKLRSA